MIYSGEVFQDDKCRRTLVDVLVYTAKLSCQVMHFIVLRDSKSNCVILTKSTSRLIDIFTVLAVVSALSVIADCRSQISSGGG